MMKPADSDADGAADAFDVFPDNVSEYADTDGDGVGDNADVYPTDASETADTDGDGVVITRMLSRMTPVNRWMRTGMELARTRTLTTTMRTLA